MFDDMSTWIIIVVVLVVAVFFYAMMKAMRSTNSRFEQLQRYWDIEIGMPEEEMLFIMGEGYNRSLLKNGRIKYEWRINASSYGTSYKGISTRSYSGVKKVTIYTKNGLVEEVKPYNV